MPGLSLHAESSRQLVASVPPIQDVQGGLVFVVVDSKQTICPSAPNAVANPHVATEPHNPNG
jgi:hypothetical protein